MGGLSTACESPDTTKKKYVEDVFVRSRRQHVTVVFRRCV